MAVLLFFFYLFFFFIYHLFFSFCTLIQKVNKIEKIYISHSFILFTIFSPHTIYDVWVKSTENGFLKKIKKFKWTCVLNWATDIILIFRCLNFVNYQHCFLWNTELCKCRTIHIHLVWLFLVSESEYSSQVEEILECEWHLNKMNTVAQLHTISKDALTSGKLTGINVLNVKRTNFQENFDYSFLSW